MRIQWTGGFMAASGFSTARPPTLSGGKNPGDIYRTNVEGTAIVLDAAARAGVERVVYTSTVGTIGLPAAGLGNECTELPAAQLVGNYKKSKYQAEQIALKRPGKGCRWWW